MARDFDVDWPRLIDGVLLDTLVDYATGAPESVDTVYLTGSYVRGSWNPVRPNVNVYFIALPGRAASVRADLARLFSRIRQDMRAQGVDFVVDCHPFTISDRSPDWADSPLLTLTTKVLAGEHLGSRYHISHAIGLGWFTAHKVLVGRADALEVFAKPPARDEAWLWGVHQALSYYRNMLDHLPWAIDGETAPRRLAEEACRYAEEALRDGVHVGLTADEVAAGRNIEILHDWRTAGRAFYVERYGDEGGRACDTVERLKALFVAGECDAAAAEGAWSDALEVWRIVWEGYRRIALDLGARAELLRVTAWM